MEYRVCLEEKGDNSQIDPVLAPIYTYTMCRVEKALLVFPFHLE